MNDLFNRYENLLKEGRTVDASGLRQVIEMHIELLENEMQEQARIIGMGAERELALIAKVESLEKENASLKQDAAQLHGEIMNIQPKPPAYGVEMLLAYKIGHRDARHSAAELVAAMQKD